MEGKFTFERSTGHLAGPLSLVNVRYNDPASGVDARIGSVVVDLKPFEILSQRVHILSLEVERADIALTTVPPKPETKPATAFSLVAPVDLFLDKLALKHATLSQDGKPLFAADTLDFAGAWTHGGAVVKSLALRAPDGSVDVHGTISSAPGYPGDGETTFKWKASDREISGTLKAKGDGKHTTLDIALGAPTPATVTATITQTADVPWTAKVTVPRFDPKTVQPDSTLTALAISLEGSGDKQHGALTGEIGVNEHRVTLEPFRYAIDGEVLKIETLTLKTPEAAGTLHASGDVHMDTQPPSATLALDWDGVELPADLVGQPLATHGKIDASGSSEKFHAEGALSIGPPGKLSDIALNLDGTPDAIALKQLALKQAKGGLDAQGTITLKPAIGWQLTAKADKFDPGAFAAEWPGAIDFTLATDGTMTDNGPDATIKLDKLGGTLRKRPLSGNADLKVETGLHRRRHARAYVGQEPHRRDRPRRRRTDRCDDQARDRIARGLAARTRPVASTPISACRENGRSSRSPVPRTARASRPTQRRSASSTSPRTSLSFRRRKARLRCARRKSSPAASHSTRSTSTAAATSRRIS